MKKWARRRALKRIYHPYWNWEDVQDGMWRTVPKPEEEALLAAAVEFTGDAALYGSYMLRVIVEWPIACEQNLSNEAMNRLAWVGHAACSLAIKCHEYITRRAWGMLTDQQREDANEQARIAVDTWVFAHRSHPGQYTLDLRWA